MLPELLAALVLLAICVAIHAACLAAVILRFVGVAPHSGPGFFPGAWLLVRVAWWLVFSHLIQIGVWALFYWFMRCLPDLETSLYFSVVTYSTLGYGDVVLDRGWRLLAGIEALAGILMCGLSTAFFFAVVSRIRGVLLQIEDRGAAPQA